ncbi:hypothetical protein K493DRAFT_353650 [Basidiobolus meristosporus CBS 931.73]|uniref:Uncharacterized protein n=1 Tax=Basidiobolus meristosporus CBS 931.73 TaxID=1314790 RepID=A0A1Y1Y664_9FUNG|nr:hypothetical protein K493DRAFT_353650 [Basidiobolus meristosporus CBS 931.73]|eukprot:ORX93196.1 hypothetical protein K493DRAFT_353650 [Basidiobolus meristosporus CBS 931.73]
MFRRLFEACLLKHMNTLELSRFHPLQAGFRKGYSTITHSAYDRVIIPKLLHKLQLLGASMQLLKLIYSLFTNCYSTVNSGAHLKKRIILARQALHKLLAVTPPTTSAPSCLLLLKQFVFPVLEFGLPLLSLTSRDCTKLDKFAVWCITSLVPHLPECPYRHAILGAFGFMPYKIRLLYLRTRLYLRLHNCNNPLIKAWKRTHHTTPGSCWRTILGDPEVKKFAEFILQSEKPKLAYLKYLTDLWQQYLQQHTPFMMNINPYHIPLINVVHKSFLPLLLPPFPLNSVLSTEELSSLLINLPTNSPQLHTLVSKLQQLLYLRTRLYLRLHNCNNPLIKAWKRTHHTTPGSCWRTILGDPEVKKFAEFILQSEKPKLAYLKYLTDLWQQYLQQHTPFMMNINPYHIPLINVVHKSFLPLLLPPFPLNSVLSTEELSSLLINLPTNSPQLHTLVSKLQQLLYLRTRLYLRLHHCNNPLIKAWKRTHHTTHGSCWRTILGDPEVKKFAEFILQSEKPKLAYLKYLTDLWQQYLQQHTPYMMNINPYHIPLINVVHKSFLPLLLPPFPLNSVLSTEELSSLLINLPTKSPQLHTLVSKLQQ